MERVPGAIHVVRVQAERIGPELGDGSIRLTIPFSALVVWVFNMMEKISEITENPFEGGVNDVPIIAITRTIEIDLREMLGEADIPEPLQPQNRILV